MRFSLTSTGTTILAGLLCAASATPALALGFRNADQGARATGQGEAFIATADDATAVYYNPAGLVQLEGTHLTSGSYYLWPSSRYNGVNGREEMNSFSMLPHIYAASDFGLERWRFGFAANIPFGNLAEYGQNGPFRYTATDTMLAVFNFAPTVAVAVNEQLSIGASLNIYYGDTELNRFSPLSVLLGNPFLPDGKFHFEGDGVAVGATVGVMWRLHEQHTLAVVYRSPFAIDFEGNAGVRKDITGVLGNSPANAEIQFPQSVAVGYAFRPIKNLKLEFDLDWTNWDMLNNVTLHSPNPFLDASGNPTSVIPFHWQDSFFYEFGAEYLLGDQWSARAGYIFSENSIPNKSFSATVPDSDRHVFSVGLGYRRDWFQFDIAYQYSLLVSRTVRGSLDNSLDGIGDADGRWKGDGHAIILTGTLKFD